MLIMMFYDFIDNYDITYELCIKKVRHENDMYAWNRAIMSYVERCVLLLCLSFLWQTLKVRLMNRKAYTFALRI